MNKKCDRAYDWVFPAKTSGGVQPDDFSYSSPRTDGQRLFLGNLDGYLGPDPFNQRAVYDEIGVPVKFVGLGERPEDIAPFDADTFVEALLS